MSRHDAFGDRQLRLLAALMTAGLATIALVVPVAPAGPATPPTKPVASLSQSVTRPDTLQRRVIAYYFHTTQRCVSCRKIEAYSREAIETAFAADLKSGRLVWNLVNIDEKGNEHFVKDFQLYTKSLVLVDEVRGKQVQWKNLEKVWQLLNDKAGFLRYVQDETRAYLVPRS